MTLNQLTRRLIETLRAETAALDELRQTMVGRREAFVSLRTSELEESLEPLNATAERTIQIAQQREQLLVQLGPALGMEGMPSLQVLRDRLPADLRTQLDQAAETARQAAQRSRIESRVGSRLLDLSRRCRERMWGGPLEDPHAARVYDNLARTVAKPVGAGKFVRGTI